MNLTRGGGVNRMPRCILSSLPSMYLALGFPAVSMCVCLGVSCGGEAVVVCYGRAVASCVAPLLHSW